MKALIAVAALALACLPALAAEQDNPACGLLTEDETRAAFGAAATETVMNPEMTGASDCSWMSENGHSIALNRARGLAFQGNTTAADSYRSWRGNFAAIGTVEDLTGLGEAAFLFVEGTVEARALVGILRQGNVVLIGTSGISRKALLHLADLAAGRL